MKIAVIALAVGAALSTIEPASAQELVRPGWTPSGSAVCPTNYQYYQGWCRWVHRGGHGYQPEVSYDYGAPKTPGYPPPAYAVPGYAAPRYAPPGYPPPGAGYAAGHTVPPQWNHLGSAVCPENYDYVAGIGACSAPVNMTKAASAAARPAIRNKRPPPEAAFVNLNCHASTRALGHR